MRRLISITISIAICALGQSQNNVELSASMQDFNHKIFKELSKSESGNLVYSPFSIHTTLAMALLGSRSGSR